MEIQDLLFPLFKAVVLGAVLLWLVNKLRRYSKGPPGPWGLPFIGMLPWINKENALIKAEEYKRRYGKIFSMRLGNFDVAVINDYKLITEALKKDEFQGRPDFESWILRNGQFKNRGILFSDGIQSWREQRRFALKNLKDFGFGKESMEGMLLHEVDELVKEFRKSLGQPVSLRNNFNCSVFNSLWYILAGERFEMNDPNFKDMIGLFSGFLDKQPIFSPNQLYPWPTKYNLVRPGLWEQYKKMLTTILGHVDNIIEDHLKTYKAGVNRDFVDIYLQQHLGEKSEDSSFSPQEGLKNLRITLLDMFNAGTETTATTLHWAVLYMCKYPEVQRKLQEEIDRVLEKNPVSRDDKHKLPYLEAFTNEVHRRASIIPMSVYHKVLKDCEFNGYLFKKGTVIYPNLYDAHHDKEFWGDPHSFRPERFLDARGTKVESKEALMPFSTGKRICLGEILARDTLFYFLTGIIQNFNFELDPESPDVDVNTPKPNFIKAPADFKVIIKAR